MHFYSKEFKGTKYIHVLLAVISAAISYFVNSHLDHLDLRIVGAISFFSVFALLELLFEKYAWRLLTYFPSLGIIDFSGVWKGSLQLGINETQYPAEINIRQTWSRILISFEGDDASGRSFSAAVNIDRLGEGEIELVYNYYARSKLTKPRNHFDHYGTAMLRMNGSDKRISGEYFTEKSRNSFGTMSLELVNQ